MTVEDRLHATTDALSGTTGQVRPLTLPAGGARPGLPAAPSPAAGAAG